MEFLDLLYDFVKQTVMFHMVTSLIYGVTPILFSVIKGKTKTCATPAGSFFPLTPSPLRSYLGKQSFFHIINKPRKKEFLVSAAVIFQLH